MRTYGTLSSNSKPGWSIFENFISDSKHILEKFFFLCSFSFPFFAFIRISAQDWNVWLLSCQSSSACKAECLRACQIGKVHFFSSVVLRHMGSPPRYHPLTALSSRVSTRQRRRRDNNGAIGSRLNPAALTMKTTITHRNVTNERTINRSYPVFFWCCWGFYPFFASAFIWKLMFCITVGSCFSFKLGRSIKLEKRSSINNY